LALADGTQATRRHRNHSKTEWKKAFPIALSIDDYLAGRRNQTRVSSIVAALGLGDEVVAAFRTFLVVFFLCLGGYTLIVGMNHGWDLLPLFFADIGAMTWAGQFNLDFTGFLVLSALWLAWRHDFSAVGLALGAVGFFGGMGFLTVYLFVASLAARGDPKVLLLGRRRAS
jgi:hypothetical protein